MTRHQQTSSGEGKGGPGRMSRWFQRRANTRTSARIRRKGGSVMGLELLILHAVGRGSGQPREAPVAWFADDEDGWLIVASGGGSQHPDWYANLMARPEGASVEFHGSDPVPVTPHRHEGSAREQAWQHIAAAQPRIAKYQSKSDREYPVVRLTRR